MRFEHEPSLESKLGNKRTNEGFLLFPKTLWNPRGFKETRWLERANWVEEVVTVTGAYRGEVFRWRATQWVVEKG